MGVRIDMKFGALKLWSKESKAKFVGVHEEIKHMTIKVNFSTNQSNEGFFLLDSARHFLGTSLACSDNIKMEVNMKERAQSMEKGHPLGEMDWM